MKNSKSQVHPYIPNSVPEITAEMLEEIGVETIDELYADIPEHLRFTGKMDLPQPLSDECSLKRHVTSIMAKNRSTVDCISFLGGGCWPHHVPAICDEVNSRSEFLTAYAGEPYEDHGRFQALFEYESMMGELLEMDVVNVPTFDWSPVRAPGGEVVSHEDHPDFPDMVKPFTPVDREADYRQAWAHFEARLE